MLHGKGGQNQDQGQGQGQGQGSGSGQGQPSNLNPQQPMHQLPQQLPMGEHPMAPHPFFHNMGPPPPPMGQMMPGFGFNQPGMDQQMYMHMMQHGQRGPPMAQFPPGPPPQQSRPPPQGNAVASLLQSLNQPTSMDLQASTESLKLALFGAPKQESTSTQQKTDNLKMALFGGTRPNPSQQPLTSPKKEEVDLLAMLQKPSNYPSGAPQPPQETKVESSMETRGMEPKKDSSVKSPLSKDNTPPLSSSKAKFTYVNPFHSFTSSASTISASASTETTTSAAPAATMTTPPTQSRTGTPSLGSQDQPSAGPSSSKRSSTSAPVQRRETPTHGEQDTGGRPLEHDQKRYQLDQLLPPHSAWNHRVQKLAKGSSSIPDGVYLDHPGSGITTYDTGMDNSDAIFSEDLETIPITLIPTDVTYNHGKMVAVSKGYISYAAKGGKIRVIQQAHGHRTLLRGHTEQVIDMAFSSDVQDSAEMQLLATVGKDSRIIIWDLSGYDVDSTDIAHSKYLELVGAPQTDQPRYSRIAWSPTQPTQLALVNNDDHSVLIVDIHDLVEYQAEDSPVVSEAQLLPHSLIIQAHDQAINDISFSRDGSVLVTASEDGSVKFWDLCSNTSAPTLLNELVPHGGLGVTNAMFVDQPDATNARCVVTACRRGTELSLWHVAGFGPLDQFVFKEPPSASRRSSLGKSALRHLDIRMFNFMGYDYETASLVLANSARLSLFGLKIKVGPASDSTGPSGKVNQATYIRSSLGQEKRQFTAAFDFMIEYPMPQPVVSFVVMPDSSLEYNGFSVYCMQAKAVQQYIIKDLEPHDKYKCQTFVSAPPTTKPSDSRPKANSKAGAPKSNSPPSNKGNDGGESLALFKTDKTSLGASTSTHPTAPEAQEKEPEKPIKLHGPVINGAIAKLKEKKRNSAPENQAMADGTEKKEQSRSSAQGRMGRKDSQDLSLNTPQTESANTKRGQTSAPAAESKQAVENAKASGRNSRQQSNRHQETADATLPALEPLPSSTSSGNISISVGDLQSMLQAMEDRIASRFEKKLNTELEQQYRKMEQDQAARQEATLKHVTQNLAKNTEQLLVQTVNKEIQNTIVPSLNKIVGAAVERQLARTMSDTALKALPTAIDTAVSSNVERVMGGTTFLSALTTQVASTIRPSIEDSFKESFTKVLIPSYQKATQAMFQQIHSAFQSGIEDLTSANRKDQETIEGLSANVKAIASSVDVIQTSLTQAAQAPSEQLPGTHPRLEQQRRSTTSGLQRALLGEDIRPSSDQGSRRASQQASPVESKQTIAINQLIAYGDFEEAFMKALSTNDPNTVLHICSKVSPRAVFQQTTVNPSGTLSQPVLLALTHYLANQDLGSNLGVRLTWLQEILMRLNPKDPLLGDHMSQILTMVQKRLEATYTELGNTGEPSPHMHTLQLLLRFVHSMQL
ncbi:hypothetical protein BG011_008654 [Mortierella polycephala]|uniref:Enhancer of mRNA-decapping protein 4 WD40 repeat region domain-containing protein n=1 Tax=Mortierella polycephala TaxID=41804 RepID=A0A9P6PPA9_9FUNG|nr:hypothetical protein BG011_008654 [Mortierella polycephala]